MIIITFTGYHGGTKKYYQGIGTYAMDLEFLQTRIKT